MFEIFKKKEDNSYEARLSKLEKRVFRNETDILDALTTIEVMRNKVLKKIKNKKDDEIDEEPRYMSDLIPKSEDLNSKIGIMR